MSKSKLLRHDPALPVRIVVYLLLAAALAMFFLPFVSYSSILIDGERSMSGLKMVLAFTSDKPIAGVKIGPLPCNFYVLFGFIYGFAALVLMLLPRLYAKRYLLGMIGSYLACVTTLMCGIRLEDYYVKYTANGGDILANYLESDYLLTIGIKAPYVLAIVFFLLAGICCTLLYSHARHDPTFSEFLTRDEE